jgi:hypothetical protein
VPCRLTAPAEREAWLPSGGIPRDADSEDNAKSCRPLPSFTGLCERMQSAADAASSLHLEFALENGEISKRQLSLSFPVGEPGPLPKILRLHLEAHAVEGAVARLKLRLVLTPVVFRPARALFSRRSRARLPANRARASCQPARRKPLFVSQAASSLGTAKEFSFLSLENETGVANIIVTPKLFDPERKVLTQDAFTLIAGTL